MVGAVYWKVVVGNAPILHKVYGGCNSYILGKHGITVQRLRLI